MISILHFQHKITLFKELRYTADGDYVTQIFKKEIGPPFLPPVGMIIYFKNSNFICDTVTYMIDDKHITYHQYKDIDNHDSLVYEIKCLEQDGWIFLGD